MARVVQEGSTSYHSLAFTGKDGEVIIPEALRYQLQDGADNVLIEWTVLPTNTIEIEIAAEHNLIGPGSKDRVLTVEVTHNGGRKITKDLRYGIWDLHGL